jgi:hypothetical protein
MVVFCFLFFSALLGAQWGHRVSNVFWYLKISFGHRHPIAKHPEPRTASDAIMMHAMNYECLLPLMNILHHVIHQH